MFALFARAQVARSTRYSRVLAVALVVPLALHAQADASRASAQNPVHFTLKTLDGDTVRVGTGAGTTLVAVFATWCVPCRDEVPALNMLQREFRNRVRVIGVTVDEGNDQHIQGWLKNYDARYPVARSSATNAAKEFGVHGVPAVFLVDGDGKITWENDGALLAVLPILRARLKELPERP
jgi:thiol-disulfide isomerase/thioredoxin